MVASLPPIKQFSLAGPRYREIAIEQAYYLPAKHWLEWLLLNGIIPIRVLFPPDTEDKPQPQRLVGSVMDMEQGLNYVPR